MDFIKFLTGASSARGCDHTRNKLQRKLRPQLDLKIGLPGIGSAISVRQNQPDYLYHCPTCNSDLPTNNNSRWEALFNSYKPPVAATRKISSSREPVKSTSSKRKSAGASSYKRESIGAKLRYDILTRDSNRCVKCGARGGENQLHIDHIIPVSKGGTNTPSNLQTLCERCNLGKGTRIG
jgi:5-methylcytosine-specific restriction endonuclease McrA